MPTLGELLREERRQRNLSLQQIEADTKIRKKYLIALEEDDYSSMPAMVYAHGFVQIYAEYLGIDPAFAGNLFQPPVRTTNVQTIRPAAAGFKETRVISTGALLTVVAVLFAIVGVVFLYVQYLSYSAAVPSEPVARPTAIQATATSRPVAIVVPTPMPTATAAPTPTPRTGVEVLLTVTERTWLRVVVDNQSQPLFEGEVQAGTVRTWTAKDRMDMRVGNAGGVEVTVNGLRQGKLGASGEVKNITWGRQ